MIHLKKVSKIYPHATQPVTALNAVSLKIPKGSFTLLMGPSGCGKSTLLNLIGGLDFPTSGEIFFDGQSTEHFEDRDWTVLRRSEIGMIFQFFNLLPMLSAQENIALPLLLRGDATAETQQKAREALARVGLRHRMDHLPAALSGGEMQRVAIARADAISPKLLLADEPTGNLDSKTGQEILKLLASRTQNSGLTLLMATHSIAAASFADQIIHMKDGEIDRIEILK
ncbi:ABC-type antimicrobial peptide transport system, ATPase component [hydrothermal vent metagenome]|uniref:ABC-type antimicrobial peptide transport system, ATPase component n=1 Tax=hydrothermal vent metagenome TaxID=652676 RepID=A0A3B1CLE2_9ZZZZ